MIALVFVLVLVIVEHVLEPIPVPWNDAPVGALEVNLPFPIPADAKTAIGTSTVILSVPLPASRQTDNDRRSQARRASFTESR